jgi:hypothetical protein
MTNTAATGPPAEGPRGVSNDGANPLSVYDKCDIYFQGRLASTELSWSEGDRVHVLHQTITFAKSLNPARRLVGAKVPVWLQTCDKPGSSTPKIRGITPVVKLIQWSDRENEARRGRSGDVDGKGGSVTVKVAGETFISSAPSLRGCSFFMS